MNINKEIEKIKKFHKESKMILKLKNLAMAIKAAKLCGLKDKLIYNNKKVKRCKWKT